MLLRSIESRTSYLLSSLPQRVLVKATNVQIQPVRCKTVINTIRPRNDHFWTKKMKFVYKPKKPQEFDAHLPQAYKCRKHFTLALRKLDNEEEENPYERIIANEIKEHIVQSKMLLLLHMNPIGGYELFEGIKKFVKADMKVISDGKNTIKMAVEDTKFDSIMALFHKNTYTWMITCPEVKLNEALGLLKHMPFFVLMAGIVEDRFLYRHQLEEYGKAKSIDEVRAQLLATLNAPATQLVQNLTRHQSTTVAYLDQYVTMKTTRVEKSSNTEQVEASSNGDPENK